MGRKNKMKKTPEHAQEMGRRFEQREERHRLVLECRQSLGDPLSDRVAFRRVAAQLSEDGSERRFRERELEEEEVDRLSREMAAARFHDVLGPDGRAGGA